MTSLHTLTPRPSLFKKTFLALTLGSLLIGCSDDNDDKNNNSVDKNIQAHSKILAPGESLNVTHRFSQASASAQYLDNQQLRSVESYPQLNSPVVGEPINDFSSNGRLGSLHGTTLNNGNIVLSNNQSYMIIDPTANELLPFTEISPGIDICTLRTAAMADGGFVAVLSPCAQNEENSLTVRRFDANGSDIGFSDEVGSSVKVSSNFGTNTDITATSNGFAVAFENQQGDVYLRQIHWYAADGTEQQRSESFAADGFGYDTGLTTLNDDRLLWVFADEVEQGNDLTSLRHTRAEVYSKDAIRTHQHVLSGTYLGDDVVFAQASNGNTLLGFELGGPDAMGYAVIDGEGNMIHPTTTISEHEPDYYNVAVFGDDDFALVMAEDESEASLMWNINNNGQLQHNDPIRFGHGWEMDYRPATFTSDKHEIGVVFDVYTNPDSRMVKLTKNYLPVKKLSDSEFSVTNWGAKDVEVILNIWEIEGSESENN